MTTQDYRREVCKMCVNSGVLVGIVLAVFYASKGCAFLESTRGTCPREWECLSRLNNQALCPEGTLYQKGVAVGGCCPACVKFLSIYEPCDEPNVYFKTSRFNLIQEDEIFISDKCAPGLSCQMDVEKHEFLCLPNGECFSYQYKKNAFWKPSCDNDGTYSAVQCKGDYFSGRCFCNDRNGKRIFGESWWIDAEDMTCACSREIASSKRADVSLHCTQNGNYENLQCDDGLCWCADSKTGLPLCNLVPEKMVQLLPCYLGDGDDFQYLRECESVAVAAGQIKDILYKHGIVYSNMATDRCDPDGSYGNFQIDKNQIRCTWKDRSLIGGYASPINQITIVDCNCAKDSIIFEQNGKTMNLECAGNGNYFPKQFFEEKSFCVDSDGYPTTGFINIIDCPLSV